MRIKDVINEAGNDFGISQIVAEKEFNTLALAVADINMEFCTFLEDQKYLDNLSSKATMVITNQETAGFITDRGICISDNPRISYFSLHNYLTKKECYLIRPTFDTIIGDNCSISNLSYISDVNVKIGDNVIIEEFVSIKENTIIGDNTIIRSGTVIGSEGYEFKRINNEVLSIKHVGWTEIRSNVEIQHNSCVDKAIYPWDRTLIGEYCKIDNLVHIAHAVKLGKGVFVVAGSLMGGRTVVGPNTWIGVGAIISNGLIIGKDAKLNLGSVVTKDVEDSKSVSGNFAIDHKKFIEFIKTIR